jgi:hypothetical protein
LAKQSEFSAQEQLTKSVEVISNSETPNGKKLFIEPEISPAVDVLEATTFFQAVDSGATN